MCVPCCFTRGETHSGESLKLQGCHKEPKRGPVSPNKQFVMVLAPLLEGGNQRKKV